MKILNVNMSIDPVTGGGTAERTVKISQYLARSGVESSLLTSDIGVDEKLRNSLSNVKLHMMKNLYSRYYISRFTFKRIAKIVAEADVVHLMNHWTAINAAVYRACQQLHKPYVVCPAGALTIYGRSWLLKRIYNRVVGNQIIKNATRHIAIPVEEACRFREYGVDPDSVKVIPNGIDEGDFKSRNDDLFRRKHALGDAPFVLFLGRLNSIKGPDLLLDAFSKLHLEFPEYHLVFAGPDGGMLESLKAMSLKTKIEKHVHFIGYIGGDEKSHAYHAAELLAIPSRQEAMSIVALEAGITGTPVLITDQCGFDDVEYIGGGIVVPASVKGLQIGLNKFFNSKEELRSIGESLKAYVLENFTWDAIVKKYIELYERIINQNI